MLYDNRIAAAFLEGRPVTEEKHFYLLQEYKEADRTGAGLAAGKHRRRISDL